jgi:hypothetical protein
MMRKIYLLLTALIAFGFSALAQNNPGSIKVQLVDKKNPKEGISFANVVVYQGKVQVGVGTTDIDGYAFIKLLPAGTYNIKAVYIGYQPQQINDVIVNSDKTTYLTIKLSNEEGVNLEEVVVTEYGGPPLINPNTISGGDVDRKSFQAMADKSVAGVLSTQAGVYSNSNGDINLRGARGQSQTGGGDQGVTAGPSSITAGGNMYVDGERIIGTINIPQQAIEQMSVMTGGIPAQYGDVNSGVISITTRNVQPRFVGGLEAISSGNGKNFGTDKYGYNFLGFSLGGPIISRKDTSGNKKPMIGFFVGGEVVYQKDPSPWATGITQVKQDKLSQLQQNPLVYNPVTDNYYLAASYLNANDFYTSATRPNAATKAFRINPKVDISVNPNLNITIGGSMDYNVSHDFIYLYALLNSQHNPQVIQNTTRGYIRLVQKFGPQTAAEKEKSQALFKGAYFTMQAGYQKYKFVRQDEQFKDNFWDYGYVGKFERDRAHLYVAQQGVKAGSSTLTSGIAYVYAGDADTMVQFTPGTVNPLTTAYTSQLMNLYAQNGVQVNNMAQITQNNGLLNGDNPGNVHQLWYNTGRVVPGYNLTDNRIFRFTSNFTADIKNHSIVAGVEFDQRDERSYNVSTTPLWSLARQLANQHTGNGGTPALDSAHLANNFHAAGTYTGTPGQGDQYYDPFTGQMTYAPNNTYAVVTNGLDYNASQQSVFSKNFYDQVMGIHDNSQGGYLQFINIDKYDPSVFNINMFSPDELLGGGSALVDAWGYDYYGNRLKSKTVFNDFLNKYHMDKFGDTIHDRNVGAFRPIYMAGYIQDRFDFKDIKFNVGVRIDRYDAHQQVLKDKYSLYETVHVNELPSGYGGQVPSSIPSDAVVYVDDNTSSNPTIIGYREGDNWYDTKGNAVADPKAIGELSGGQAKPWLKDPTAPLKGPYENSAFTAYKPQINVMPRVAFSFPISDLANFFAHYDILTQRPGSGFNRMDPKDYYFMSANQGGVLANPNLKSERTVDYELGFSQLLNEKKTASLQISAFYREMRNLIQIIRVNQAYPLSYLTYGNIDFSTVKGFSAEFKMRRTGGIQFSANYTLQFAEGSGSSASGGINLASSSQPNLRVLLPLDFDQRHTLAANFDYRFGEGKDYRGPKTVIGGKTYNWLENFGFNVVPRVGSGTPYTRRYPPKADEEVGNNINQTIFGDLNGSRLPWQFRTDMRIDKNFQLTFGSSKGEDKQRVTNLNVYFQILNLFNNKNVIAVHNYTGSPTDDGYLSSNIGINEINQKAAQGAAYSQAFIDQYRAKLNDGTYFSTPRQFRIGVQFDF